MTMEKYVESILQQNPSFVAEMDKILRTEYAEQIRDTQASFNERFEAARQNWITKHGEEAFLQNEEDIRQHISSSIPRYCYIKNLELSGDRFEAEIDLLNGAWRIAPV